MAGKTERIRKPLEQQGGQPIKSSEDRQHSQDRNDPTKPRQPHFDESDVRQQGSTPEGDRQVR